MLPGERKEVLNIPRNRKNSGHYMCNANGEEGNLTSNNTVKVTIECKSIKNCRFFHSIIKSVAALKLMHNEI